VGHFNPQKKFQWPRIFELEALMQIWLKGLALNWTTISQDKIINIYKNDHHCDKQIRNDPMVIGEIHNPAGWMRA